MNKKIVSFLLCFTIIFVNIDFSFATNKENISSDFIVEEYELSPLYAPAVVAIAPEIVATIGTFLVASGCSIVSQKMLNDVTRKFYNDNEDNWDEVVETFKTSVKKVGNGMVTIGSAFLQLLSKSFDSSIDFTDNGGVYTYSAFFGDIPVVPNETDMYFNYDPTFGYAVTGDFEIGPFGFVKNGNNLDFYYNGSYYSTCSGFFSSSSRLFVKDNYLQTYRDAGARWGHTYAWVNLSKLNYSAYVLDMPLGYSKDKLQTDEKDNSICVGIPNTLDKFVDGTITYDNVYNPSYDTTTDGNVGIGSLPGVSNPSIEYGDSITIPGVSNPPVDVPNDTPVDVPSEGIWATITDFVIGLVVPGATFWTDTWGGLYDSFTNAFPGVDMSNFDKLVTGEKKFPNIDVNIMGVKGRVVNGDVINSIVDWLRPIIAGFMMLCLMFFNYRKIYKLIRNSEPFGGIAPGTSDFSTGISEYSHNYLNAKHIIGENLRVMTSKGGK